MEKLVACVCGMALGLVLGAAIFEVAVPMDDCAGVAAATELLLMQSVREAISAERQIREDEYWQTVKIQREIPHVR